MLWGTGMYGSRCNHPIVPNLGVLHRVPTLKIGSLWWPTGGAIRSVVPQRSSKKSSLLLWMLCETRTSN
jgi:hypothetical protein